MPYTASFAAWALTVPADGSSVLLSADWDAHALEAVGFVRQPFAEPAGQVGDWTFRLPGGSRVHAHVFADGSVRIHRDRWDPDAGFLSMAKHVALETTTGRIVCAALATYVLAKGIQRLAA